jgi:hypothetical protein
MPETVESPSSPVAGGQVTGAFDAIDPKNKELMQQLTGIQEREMSEKARIAHRTEGTVHADQARAQKFLDAESVGPDALPPKWDAEAEGRKHAYDPFDAFGSFGSVFGILASAFTHMPMDSALNASASAMQAIKAGKDDEYKRAYTAWKDNTELVIKRQNMIHQVYQDAITKMSTDMNAGRVELENAMIRFGDEKKLAMFRAGHVAEVFQAVESEAKSTAGIEKAKVDGFNSSEQAEAGMRLRVANQNLEKAREEAAQAQDPGAVVGAQQKLQSAVAEVKKARDRMQEVQQTTAPAHYETEADRRTRLFNNIKLDHPEWDDLKVEEELNKREQLARAGGAGRGPGSVQAQDYESLKKLYRQEVGPDKRFKSIEEADHAAAQDARRTPMGEAGEASLKKRIDDYTTSLGDIDQGLGFLDKYVFGTGPFSKIGRSVETISDILHISDDTDRRTIVNTIDRLKAMARTLGAESQTRALKEEERYFIDAIGGFGWGDTTEKMRHVFEDLKERYTKLRQNTSQILHGEWSDPTPGARQSGGGSQRPTAAPTKPVGGGPKPWERGGSDYRAMQQ